jgi:hypothetical protein
VQLAGASLGRGCLKRHGIYAGFRMEFYWGGRRVVTSPVQSILRERAAAQSVGITNAHGLSGGSAGDELGRPS